MSNPKLIKKIVISGKLKAITAIRIGGNKSSLEIGGIDNNVIKTGNGVPFIPGSSLKGKMRSLLAKVKGYESVEKDGDEIKRLFGTSGEGSKGETSTFTQTRLQVKDLHLDQSHFKQQFDTKFLDFEFTQIKTENKIVREKGSAEHPRQVERIPGGSEFELRMILDIYEGDVIINLIKLLKTSFKLLELDYVGGHGTKGSGEVKIVILQTECHDFDDKNLSDEANNALTDLKDQFKN